MTTPLATDEPTKHIARERSQIPLTAQLAGDLLPPSDFIAVLLGSALSHWVQLIWAPAAMDSGPSLPAMAWVVAALVAFALYEKHFAALFGAQQLPKLVKRFLCRAFGVLVLILTLGSVGQWADSIPAGRLATWAVITVLLLIACRLLLLTALSRLARQDLLLESVAVIGSGLLADHSISRLSGHAKLYGLYDDRGPRAGPGLTNRTGSVGDLIVAAAHEKPGRILIALPALADARLQQLVAQLQPLGIAIELSQQSFSPLLATPHISYVGESLPVTMLADQPIHHWSLVLKTAKDLLLCSLLVLLLLPLLGLIALAIKLDSPGPVLFLQRRYGFKRREFNIYKFRTMRCVPAAASTGATGDLQQTQHDDPRVTRVGRWLRKASLDELPQLFNVLGGSMSLVGPRPHAVNMRTDHKLGHEVSAHYPHRYRVKPGITGWSQVNGARGATHTSEQLRRRIALDIHYVEHWSMWLDLQILSRTFGAVVRSTNAY